MEQNPSSGKKKLAFVVEDGVVGEDRQSPSGDGAGKPFAFLDRRAKCYSAWEEGVFFRDGDEVRLDLGGGGEGGRGPLGAGGEGEGVEGGGDIAGGSGILVQMPGAAQLSFSFKDADVGDVVFELQGGAEADA